MFLWTCFVNETVMILYDMRSRTTMYIVKCGGTYSPREIRVQLL